MSGKNVSAHIHMNRLARARRRDTSGPTLLLFGASTKNRSSLEASLGFAAITGTPRIENGGTFAVDFADGRRKRHNFYVRPDVPQQLANTASHPAPLNRSATIQRARGRARQDVYVSCTSHNARRAGNRGKSKRRLKTTLVLG
jgi:hypothetical protein